MAADPVEVAERLAAALDEAAVPYAIGGAICLALWGVPRATKDADVNVFFGEDRLDEVLRALVAAGCVVDQAAARRRVAERGDVVLECDGVRVDVFIAFHAIHGDVRRRRVRTTMPAGRDVWMLAARDLIFFKVLFGRTKDWADIERMIASPRTPLDGDALLADLSGFLDAHDSRLDRLRSLLSLRGPSPGG